MIGGLRRGEGGHRHLQARADRRRDVAHRDAFLGDGIKHLRHPGAGPLALEYAAFAVDGRPDLSLIVYNPAMPADRARVETLLAAGGRK